MLFLDVREACAVQPTGKAFWARHFAEALLEVGLPLTLLAQSDHPWLAGKPVQRIAHGGLAWHWHAAQAALRQHAVYVSPTSFIVPAFAPARLPTVAVVHDLIAFRPEPHALRPTIIERSTLPRAARRASLLCTVSAATERDVLERFPSVAGRTAVIGSGPVDDAVVADAQAPFVGAVLCVGTLCPRKNQLRLIRAHASLPLDLRERHPLVLVGGRGWHDAEIVRAASLTPYVHWIGFAEPAVLGALLHSAAAVAYPSLYEGFGIPLLTAFRRGVPVLTSDRGSLGEVAGDAAFLADPLSIDALRDGLQRLLTDDRLRMDLRERGKERCARFTWPGVAQAFTDALRAKNLLDR